MKVWLLLGLSLAANAFAQSNLTDEQLAALLHAKSRTVQHIALNPVVVGAVRRQNLEDLDADLVAKRDEAWRASDELDDFKRSLQENAAGRLLRGYVSGNDGLSEAFIADAQGANVAVYPATSDYYQGDEEKWTKAFNGGDGRIYRGPIEKDESTGVIAVQLSAPVLDKGRTIGVLVVGVTLDYLEAKLGKDVGSAR